MCVCVRERERERERCPGFIQNIKDRERIKGNVVLNNLCILCLKVMYNVLVNVKLNLFNYVLTLFHIKFVCNLTFRNSVFRWK